MLTFILLWYNKQILYENCFFSQWTNKPHMTSITQNRQKCPPNLNDRRTRKTQYAIKMAFLDLIQQKKLDQISVSELSEAADINRKTFYNHFQDIYQVLGEIEDDYAEMVMSLLNQHYSSTSMDNPYPLFLQLTEEIQANADLYQLLIETGEHVRLSKKIKAKLKTHLQQEDLHALHLDRETFEFFIDFLLAGVLSAYEQWFLAGKKLSKEVLSTRICKIAMGALRELRE